MARWETVVTIAVLGGVAIVGLVTHNDPVTYVAVGALAGYLGKVNGAGVRPREVSDTEA